MIKQKESPEKVEAGTQEMLNAIKGITTHFEQGIAFTLQIKDRLLAMPKPRRVIHCGLGGSAFPANLLKIATDSLGVPFDVSRQYLVDAVDLNAQDLVIASSFSGNTEETIESLEDALKRGAMVVVLTAGGKLKEMAKTHDLPLIELKRPSPTFQPRAATGFFVGALGALLDCLGFFSGGIERLRKIGAQLQPYTQIEDQAKSLAAQLVGKIPVIYAPAPFAFSVARVIKIKLNENAKCPAFYNEIPECNHNEMVGYTLANAPYQPIFLKDSAFAPRLQTRIQKSMETLDKAGIPCIGVDFPNESDPLVKAFAVLYFFDFVSCYMAQLAGVDPNPVDMVEDFKASLGQYQGLQQF
jgi:glucose/mannose-6-phosphate isomerase